MKTLLLGVTAVAATAACADYIGASWQADDAGNWSGSVLDTAHWVGGEVPGSEGASATRMVFPGGSGSYVVSNSEESVVNSAGIEASVSAGETLTLDGRGTNWNIPAETHDKLWFKTGGVAPLCYLMEGSAAGLTLENYLIDYSNGVEGKTGAWLDVKADKLSFSSGNGTLLLFGNWAQTGDPSGFATIRGRDTAVNVPHSLTFTAFNQPTNRVILSNSRGVFGAGARTDVWKGSADSTDNDRAGLQELYVTDGSVVTNTGGWSTGYYEKNGDGSERFSSRSKTFRLRVDNGAKLYQHSSTMNGRGRNEILVSGKGSALVWYSNWSAFANGVQSTGLVWIAEGAALTNNYALYLGPQNAADQATSWAEMKVSGSTFASKQSQVIRHGRLTLENDTLWVFSNQGYISGAGIAGATEELVLDGVRLRTIGTDVQAPNPIREVRSAKIGPRGFIFEPVMTLSNATRFDQHFEDLDPANGGEWMLVPHQYGPILLSGDSYSTESTESWLTIARGSVYLAKGCNHYSFLTVTNGATFALRDLNDPNLKADGATSARLRGLRLGDARTAGTLALRDGGVVTIDNDTIELVNAKIAYPETLGLGEHTVFCLTQRPTDATVAFWESAGASLVSSGLDTALYNTFQVIEEGGVWNFKIVTLAERPAKTGDTAWTGSSAIWNGETTWGGDSPSATVGATFGGAEPKEITVLGEQKAASLSFTDDGYVLSGDRVMIPDNSGAAIAASGNADLANGLHLYAQIPVDVAEDKALVIDGQIFGGGLRKTGEGTLRLDHADNLMPAGVSLESGTLEIGNTESLGSTGDNVPGVLSGGTLRFTEPGEVKSKTTIAGPVTVENVASGEVSMPAPTATAGSLTKTGAAPLALTVGQDDVWASGTMSPSAVEEGELRLRGENGATINLQKNFHIGRKDATSASAEPTQPGLVVSGDMTATVARLQAMEGLSADDETFVTDPYLVVSNGATLHCSDGMTPCYNNTRQSLTYRILLDNGTLKSTGSEFFLNSTKYEVASTNYITMRNGAKILSWYSNVGRLGVLSPFIVDMDHSELAGGNPNDPHSCLTMYMGGGYGPFHCTFNVRNQSVIRCRDICYNLWVQTHDGNYNQPWRFNFEDSEWDLGDESIDMPSSNMTVVVTSTGPTGIVFAPPSTRTWKIYTRIDGTGAFTKRGAGHVLIDRRMKFRAYTADPITLGLSGAIRVEDGTMKIVDGALSNMTGRVFAFANGATLDMDGVTLDHPVLTGDGRILNATLDNPSCAVSVSAAGEVTGAPTLDFSAATGRVRVDFGRDPDDPLPEDIPLVVAHWTGTKPSAAVLRGMNAGRGMKCFFTVNDDGTIVATARHVGLLMIVR